MTPEQLAEIRARAEAATLGPWECYTLQFSAGQYLLVAGPEDDSLTLACFGEDDEPEAAEANTRLAAHARTDIPALLDYIEELQEAVRAHLYRISSDIDLALAALTSKEPTNA